ncbi:GNAT family N-acetyltransferase [Vacuolonema iberomarrocanum]|uniref:GNAT family N-acetyltransferase n=1 Tax=Vacuolonema iberomarrocanum TaxID=3454632 RepID=UPI0019E20C7A|nr:GNAT family N-acetyltransferase [filamentous cyanobacterium LEGE 07170]
MEGLRLPTKRSQQLTLLAQDIVNVYARHPDVAAVILGGSTARGTAGADSDIDLGVFWQRIPDFAETKRLMQQASIGLARVVSNEMRFPNGCPRRIGRVEIGHLQVAMDITCRVDIAHETVEGTDAVIERVFKDSDAELANQELISVIHEGVVLYGESIVRRWQTSSITYPDEIARRMLKQHFLGISERVRSHTNALEGTDWLIRQGVCIDLCRHLVLALMAANRVRAFTDNTDFKGLCAFVHRLEVKPPAFLQRLGWGFGGEAFGSTQVWAALIRDVINTIDGIGLNIDMTQEKAACEALLKVMPRCIPFAGATSELDIIVIEAWDKSHSRWGELERCLQELGQWRWFNTQCDFHVSETVLVAHSQQEVIGFLRLVVQEIGPDSDLPSHHLDNVMLVEGKILAFGVLPSHRGKGIGTILLAEACVVGRLAGLFQLRAHSSGENRAAHRVLMRAGFGIHPIERHGDVEGGYFIKPLGMT